MIIIDMLKVFQKTSSDDQIQFVGTMISCIITTLSIIYCGKRIKTIKQREDASGRYALFTICDIFQMKILVKLSAIKILILKNM